jgi:hypothetical protein
MTEMPKEYDELQRLLYSTAPTTSTFVLRLPYKALEALLKPVHNLYGSTTWLSLLESQFRGMEVHTFQCSYCGVSSKSNYTRCRCCGAFESSRKYVSKIEVVCAP